MLRPLIGRVFSSHSMAKTRDCMVVFEGCFWSRTMCTVEKASDEIDGASKSDQTETSEGDVSELDQKIKLIEEKDGIINDLQVGYKFGTMFFKKCYILYIFQIY